MNIEKIQYTGDGDGIIKFVFSDYEAMKHARTRLIKDSVKEMDMRSISRRHHYLELSGNIEKMINTYNEIDTEEKDNFILERKALNIKISEQSDKIAHLEYEKKELTKKNKNLQEKDSQKLIAELKKENADFLVTVNKLRKKCENQEHIINDLQEKKEELETLAEDLIDELDDLNDEIIELNKRMNAYKWLYENI